MESQLKMEGETELDTYLEREKLKRKMKEAEIGVLRCCYGEFTCGDCGRSWTSSKAWRHFGQQCQQCCSIGNCPHNLEKLYYYCCAECVGIWKYKWVSQGRRCKACQDVKYPKTYEQFKTYWKAQGLDGEFSTARELKSVGKHDINLCEKCKLLGGHYKCTDTLVIDDNGQVKINGRPAQSGMSRQSSDINSVTPTNASNAERVVRNYHRPQAQ